MRELPLSAAEPWLEAAAEQAKLSTCYRAKCGSVVVADGKIIGQGFNSPPGNLESQRRCDNRTFSARFKSDRTCCVHAEQRAIMDALAHRPSKVAGSQLYFVRLAENGEVEFAGEPYCTICSKMALDAGVGEFILWHKDGVTAYETEEYNKLSFSY